VPGTGHRAAASTALRSALGAGDRCGRVLGVFPSAVYAELGDELIALETSDALRLPCAVVLPVPAAARPFAGLQAGDPVTAKGALLTVGGRTAVVARWWRPRRPRTTGAYDVALLSAVAATLPPLSPMVTDRLADLVRGLQARGDVRHETRALLGLGDGLTPEGDDALAGLLVALRACAAHGPTADRLADAVRELAPSRTTTVSAALLRHASEGHAIPRLLDVIDALGAPSGEGLAAAVVRLLAVGHTSGTALAHGALAAAHLQTTTRARSEVA
jgi:hypothetical protein